MEENKENLLLKQGSTSVAYESVSWLAWWKKISHKSIGMAKRLLAECSFTPKASGSKQRCIVCLDAKAFFCAPCPIYSSECLLMEIRYWSEIKRLAANEKA